MAETFEKKLSKILCAHRVISQKALDTIEINFKNSSRLFFEEFLLLDLEITKKSLLLALSEYYSVPSFDVLSHSFDQNLLMDFPQDVLVRYRFVPLERDSHKLIIVANKPDNQELLPELAEYVSDDIELQVGIRSDIIDVIMEYYQDTLTGSGYQNEIDEHRQDEFLENDYQDE